MAPEDRRTERMKNTETERNPVIPLLTKQDISLPGLRRWFSPEDIWKDPFRNRSFLETFPLEGMVDAQDVMTRKAQHSHEARVAIEEDLSTLAKDLVVPLVWGEWDMYAKPASYRIYGRRNLISAQSAPGYIEPLTRLSSSSSMMIQKADIPDGATHAHSTAFVSSYEMEKHVQAIMSRMADRTRTVTGFKSFKGSRELLSDMLLQASATHAFHKEIEEAGIPISYPQMAKAKTLDIKNARPEHLLVLKGVEHKERRRRIADTAEGLAQPHRSGSTILSQSHYHTMERSIRYASQRKPERLPEKMTREQFDEAVRLCERFPEEGQIEAYLASLSKELAAIALNASCSYLPLPLKELVRAGFIGEEIKRLHDLMLAQGYSTGGYWGSFIPKLVDDIAVEFNFPDLGIVENDISVRAGVPMAILGANGEGKTTILAQGMQHLRATGKGISSESHIPKNVDVIAVADILRLQGLEMMEKARSSGKSSFVIEVEQFIKRMDRILSSKSKNLPLVEGDEVGSKTDQLNAMALLATELIASAVKGTLSFHASHYNSLPQVVGPLLKELGIEVNWKTMDNFRLRDLREGEEVKSNALTKAAPFLPEHFVRLWMELSDSTYTPVESRREEPKREYRDFNMERLTQLGWINRYDSSWYAGFSFGGIVSSLVSSGASYSYKDYGKIAIVESLLNPRWEHIAHVPGWIGALREGANERLAGPLKILNEFAKVYDDIDRFRKYRLNNDTERDRIFSKIAEFVGRREEVFAAAREASAILPGFPAERIIAGLSRDIHTTDMADFQNKVHFAIADIVSLETLSAISHNVDGLEVNQVGAQPSGISIKNGWNWALARNLKGAENVVKNDIDLDGTSVFFTGPQGSGKTEALFTIAENVQLASLWGLTTSDKMTMGGRYEVIPLLSIPPEPKEVWGQPKRRPLSSLEREASDRIALVIDLVDNMPEGVRPVVIMDEPLTSTNTKDAGEGAIAIKEYVESKGGILIASTHFHDTLWQMEKKGIAYHAKQVELFDTPDQFRWTDGHGKSMGIEVAGKLGLDKRLLSIAYIIRGYLEQVTNEDPSSELIRETARLLAPIISEL